MIRQTGQQRVCWGLGRSPPATIRHLLAMCPSTSQVMGTKSKPLCVSLDSSEASLLLPTAGEGPTLWGGQWCLMAGRCLGLEADKASTVPLLQGGANPE